MRGDIKKKPCLFVWKMKIMKLLFYILFLLCTISLFLSLPPPLSPEALCGAARQSGLCAVFWGIQLPAVYGYTFRPIKRLDRRFLFPGQEKYLDLTLLRHGIIAITVKTVSVPKLEFLHKLIWTYNGVPQLLWPHDQVLWFCLLGCLAVDWQRWLLLH